MESRSQVVLEDGQVTSHAIAQGDVLAVLRELPSNAFDGLLCDPPYGLRFMAKRWDYDVPSVEVWREALRVLKPGAALLSFGGTRTFHRIAVGIEDAGFELRDALCWLYGKGFPKSLNVGLALDKAAGATRPVVGARVLTGNAAIPTSEKGGTYGVQVGSIPPKEIAVTAPATPLAEQWDGYGTALKPGWEPIILARKPLEGTVAQNVQRWGCGALAIDACRLERAPGDRPSGWCGHEPKPDAARRWPPNVALSHTEECSQVVKDEDGRPWRVGAWRCSDDCPIRILDAEVGERPSGKAVTRNGGGGKIFGGIAGNTKGHGARPDSGYSDGGGPSRFFYCAKVSTKERELGCESLPRRSAGECTDREDASAGLSSPRAGAGRTGGAHNHHPTLKPIALARWLASLIRPPTAEATLLVPYSGAGSEIIGALQAGWPLVYGIEGEADYVQIAHARVAAHAR